MLFALQSVHLHDTSPSVLVKTSLLAFTARPATMKFSSSFVLYGLLGLASAFPSDYLKVASWDIEGYAKDNPIGKTTGGKGGPTVYVQTAAELVAAVAGTDPKIVRVKGSIELPSRLKIGSNKSVIGVGWSAIITGAGIDVFNGDNVIVQNLKISKIVGNDGITIRNTTRVWIDHNEFESEFSQEIGPDTYVSSLHAFTFRSATQ